MIAVAFAACRRDCSCSCCPCCFCFCFVGRYLALGAQRGHTRETGSAAATTNEDSTACVGSSGTGDGCKVDTGVPGTNAPAVAAAGAAGGVGAGMAQGVAPGGTSGGGATAGAAGDTREAMEVDTGAEHGEGYHPKDERGEPQVGAGTSTSISAMAMAMANGDMRRDEGRMRSAEEIAEGDVAVLNNHRSEVSGRCAMPCHSVLSMSQPTATSNKLDIELLCELHAFEVPLLSPSR